MVLIYTTSDGSVHVRYRALTEYLGRKALRSVDRPGQGNGGRAQVHEDVEEAGAAVANCRTFLVSSTNGDDHHLILTEAQIGTSCTSWLPWAICRCRTPVLHRAINEAGMTLTKTRSGRRRHPYRQVRRQLPTILTLRHRMDGRARGPTACHRSYSSKRRSRTRPSSHHLYLSHICSNATRWSLSLHRSPSNRSPQMCQT